MASEAGVLLLGSSYSMWYFCTKFRCSHHTKNSLGAADVILRNLTLSLWPLVLST
jgi:hypothetical protein